MTEETPETPEMDSFTITASRTFEADFSDQQLEALMQQTGTESPENAIAQTIGQREAGSIEPTQKLLGINVDVEGPTDE